MPTHPGRGRVYENLAPICFARRTMSVMQRSPARPPPRMTARGRALGRRMLLTGGLTGGLAGALAGPPAAAAVAEALAVAWARFKALYLAPDGRVVDTGNGGISHSEGQGYGLLFALACDDPASFELILGWTSRTLKRPADALHAWRYVPGAARPVADLNNATDGDLLIAYALALAARRWGEPDRAAASAAIARDILRLTVRPVGARLLLLPGAAGFERPEGAVVNPSYYVFPALAELAGRAPSPLWAPLVADGKALIDEGRFGRWRLPPDWLAVARANGALAPAAAWPPRFSYDAIRVPLNLAWGDIRLPNVEAGFLAFWSDFPPPRTPAWIDLRDDARAAYPALPGMQAVAQFARSVWSGAPIGDPVPPAAIPGAMTASYYSAALAMLVGIAARDRRG